MSTDCPRLFTPFCLRNMYLISCLILCTIAKAGEVSRQVAVNGQNYRNVANLGLNVMIRSDERRMQYWENYGKDNLSSSVQDLIEYAGLVTRFQSFFMDFVRSITTEMNERELSDDITSKIKEFVPDEDVNTVFDFAKMIRLSVQNYSTVVLKSMSKLRHLPTKVKKLSKVANSYEKMGKEIIPIPKLERLFNIGELRRSFRNLGHLTNKGLFLANHFFEVYQQIAPISKDLKDFLGQKKKLNTELESALKAQEKVFREKISIERKLKLNQELKAMYQGYIKDLSTSSTNKQSIWATIVDTDIKKAKTEKLNAEQRLRDYTYRMWGAFESTWKNDVELAKIEVEKWTGVLHNLTVEKKKGLKNDDNMEKKKENYNELLIKAVTEIQEHENNLKTVMKHKLDEIETNIERIRSAIEDQKKRKKELFENNADSRASAERLIDAIESTESFATASLQQAIAQDTFAEGHVDEYKEIVFVLEDLFDEHSTLQEQKINIQLIEDSMMETPVISFLNDCTSLLSYPFMEKAAIQAMDQEINKRLLPKPKVEL